jgi:hypothetical protein
MIERIFPMGELRELPRPLYFALAARLICRGTWGEIMHKLALLVAGIALAAMPVAIAAAAQDWTHIASAEGEWDVAYDPSRLVRSGRTVKVWLRRTLVEADDGVSYYLSQAEFDCARSTARILYTAAYDAAGSILTTDPEPVPAEPIPPGSFFESIEERVCR